jgi:hypothetical protein
MPRPWLLFRVLVAGALFYTGHCSASASNDSILYNALGDCIDAQFERSSAPDSYSEIDLAADCPDLLLSLTDSDWLERTSFANYNSPSLAQLADLRYFLLGSFSEPEPGEILDFSRLESILAETLDTDKHEQGQNWWERLLSWLRQRHKDQDDVDLLWLEEWLDKFSLTEATAELLLYSITFILILLAVGLVINEVRLARQGRSLFRSRDTTRPEAAVTSAATVGTLAGTQQKARTAPELLNACIEYLIHCQRLPDARSKTNREYLLHLTHNGDSAAAGFGQLLQQAERILYGDRQIDAHTLQHCHQQANTLMGTGDDCYTAKTTAAGTNSQ